MLNVIKMLGKNNEHPPTLITLWRVDTLSANNQVIIFFYTHVLYIQSHGLKHLSLIPLHPITLNNIRTIFIGQPPDLGRLPLKHECQ